jgi:hypothetical protein
MMNEINETQINESDINESDFLNVAAAVARWETFPASGLSHHGELCCRVAREWVLANDGSQLNGAAALTGPRWLRHKYTWGPSRWPMHWCEAVREKTLDCGALAALAHEVFTARGVRSYPAQFIQHFSAEATSHWRMKWEDGQCTLNWIDDELIYHEGCAVVSGERELKLWDASAGWWLNPRQVSGYGGLLALRVFTPPADSHPFTWGQHHIAPNQWQRLEARPLSVAACG